MKRYFIILLSASVAILFLAACSKANQDSGTVSLKAYFQGDPANPQSRGTNAAIEAFLSANPQTKLDIEYGSGEAFHQKFQAMAVSNTMPDLFTVYIGKRSAYITETEKVLDLRPYLSDDFKRGFTEEIWQAQGKNGEIYTIAPSLAVTHTMFANKDLLDELDLRFPATYDELLQQIETIRQAGYYPISLGNKDQWPVNSWLLSVLVDRIGGKEWFAKAMDGTASFEDPPFLHALEIINEMAQKKAFSPGINQMSNSEADQEFYQKKSVYLIDAAWRVSGMVNSLSAEDQDQVSLGVFPALENEVHPGSSTAVPSEGYGISASLKGTERADAAWEFIAFFNGRPGAELRLQHGEIPTYLINADEADIPELQKRLAHFIANTEYGYVIDAKMDPAGMTNFNRNLQSMLFGNISAREVAQQYEAWVSANDSNRGN